MTAEYTGRGILSLTILYFLAEHTSEILLPDDGKITEISGMIYYKIGVELPLLYKIARSSISIGKTLSSGKSYNTRLSTIDHTVYLARLPTSVDGGYTLHVVK